MYPCMTIPTNFMLIQGTKFSEKITVTIVEIEGRSTPD